MLKIYQGSVLIFFIPSRSYLDFSISSLTHFYIICILKASTLLQALIFIRNNEKTQNLNVGMGIPAGD
jgi:hypothetical protein